MPLFNEQYDELELQRRAYLSSLDRGSKLGLAAQNPAGKWRIGNIIDNFVSGVRQGMLLDNMLFSDPEVQASTDVPVVRIVGLLAGAIGEGALTQSWALRGIQAVAKTSKVPKVQQAAQAALDGWLLGDELDFTRKLAGHAALGASVEGALHLAGGRSPQEALTATAMAAGVGSVAGGVLFGVKARSALARADEVTRGEAGRSFGKLRELVNEHMRYEGAMRQYPDLGGLEGRDYSDDWRLLKAKETRAGFVRQREIAERIIQPIQREADRDGAWKSFLGVVQQSAELAQARVRGGDVSELQRAFDEQLSKAPAGVRAALEAHKQMTREIAQHARERLAEGSSLQTTLFDAAGDQLDDMDYAALLADLDAQISGVGRFHVQFLRRGAFIERKARDLPRNYLEMMHRATTRMDQDRAFEEFLAETQEKFKVQLTPEQAKEALQNKFVEVPLSDGKMQRVVPFNARPGRIYPTWAVTEAMAEALNRRGSRGATTLPRGASADVDPIWGIDEPHSFFLPEDIATRLTRKMLGGRDALGGTTEALHSGVIGGINKLTGAWKYNTIWWGLSRFAGIQVIGDSLSGLRSNPAVFLQRTAGGRIDSPAVRAIREIFREYRTPVMGDQQRMEAGIGAAVGLAGNEAVNDDATWVERAAAALAGSIGGYAHGTWSARGSLPAILATRASAAPGMPVDYNVHVPAPLPAVAGKLAKTRVVDEATGQPKVVFHGTGRAFDEFDEAFLNGHDWAHGFFFTEDPDVATIYAQKASGGAANVRIARLRIENPIDLDGPVDPALAENIFNALSARSPELADAFASGMLESSSNLNVFWALTDAVGTKEASKLLRELGYDGMTHLNSENTARSWIAFDKTQIHDAFEAPLSAVPLAETYAARTAEARADVRRVEAPELVSWYKMAQKGGVVGSGSYAQETELARKHLGGGYSRIFPDAGGERSKARRAGDTVLTLLSGRVHGDPAQFAHSWSSAVETVMNERENWLRLASFMQQVESGIDPRVAAKRARETFVDYGKFTEFEDRYARGFLLPFYAFTRHNTANWLRTLGGKDVGGKPAVALAAAGAIAGIDVAAQAWNSFFFGETEAQLADWQRSQFHVIIGNPFTGEAYKDARGRPMVMMTEMGYEPTLDLLGLARPHHALNLFGAGLPAEQSLFERKLLIDEVASAPLHVRETLSGGAALFARLLSPALRVPIELAGNESWLYDAPIVPEHYVGTPDQHAFMLKHVAREAFRQYREADRIVADTGKGEWSPINSAFGLGLPVEAVNTDANLRRALHERMERAITGDKRNDAQWRRPIDDIVYGRQQWNVVSDDEEAQLMRVLRENTLSPDDREEAVRYYMGRTAKSSVARHWQTMSADARARFLRELRPADTAAFAFYVNGGEGLVQLAQSES